MASPLDAARRGKDRSYKHIFKGSVMINTLMEYDKGRFLDRTAAVAFGQKLLDLHHIESIVGNKYFEDGVSLYRWCDETVVQQAKKLVTTTSAHIPKRRLIELLDMEHGEGPEGYDRQEMQDRVVAKLDRTVSQPEPTRPEQRSVGRLSRKELEFAQLHSDIDNDATTVNGYSDTVNSYNSVPNLSNIEMEPIRSLSCNSDGNVYTEQSSTEEYTSTSDNIQSPSDSAEAESPIDSRLDSNDASDTEVNCSSQPAVYDNNTLKPQPEELQYLDIQKQKVYEDLKAIQLDLKEEDREALATLENLTQESCSFSDNEKTLLEQMKKMQQEHQSVVHSYEDRLDDLVKKVTDMRNMADLIKDSQTPKPVEVTETKSAIPAAPAVPMAPSVVPPVPTLNLFGPKVIQPNKRAVKPRVKMRPLFWNRIIVDDKKKKAGNTIWKSLTEPNFDVDEFETVFGMDPSKQQTTSRSLHDAMSPTRSGTEKAKTVKLLEDNRSRAIGIKLRSLHCQMGDIRDAVYKLQFDKLDMDSLQGLYELRGNPEEIGKIDAHLKQTRKRSSTLDQPEQFLYEVSRMQHFEERVECLIFKKRFNETLFNINEQLDTLKTACDSLRNNESLKKVLEIVLAFGNYMNGGTQRGQADGFDINILSRLKDVKSMDNTSTLLNFIVRIHTREHEIDAGQNQAQFRLPEPSIMQQAAVVSLKDLQKDLQQMQPNVKSHAKKADKVASHGEKAHLRPFKNLMDDFFDSASVLLKRQMTKFEEVKACFNATVDYLSASNSDEEVTSDSFFSLWGQFLMDYKLYWVTEQKRIAKDMFAKIEQRKKERRQKVKRRNSIVEEGRENLKQKFAQMRRRSEHAAPHTAMLIRSQSVSSIDTISSQSTNSLERSLERRKRSSNTNAVTTAPSTPKDDDSVFGDDEWDRRSTCSAVVQGVSGQRSRRREQPETPRTVPDPVPAKPKPVSRATSESGVDQSRQRDLPKMPSRLTSLGDTNIRLKYYFYKNQPEEKQPEQKQPQVTATDQAEKATTERQRHRFVPDAVSKTGESMIERLQQRRQRNSRVSMDEGQTQQEAGYESSQTVKASGSNEDTDKENNIQDRIARRRRSRTEEENTLPIEQNLSRMASGMRRSRANLAADEDMSVAQKPLSQQLSNGLRRSRANLNEDNDNKTGASLTSVPGSVRRSRANLSEESKDTKTDPASVGRHSAYLRRSRANLFDDTQSEGQGSDIKTPPTNSLSNQPGLRSLTQARSRYGESMDSLKSIGSSSQDGTGRTRNPTPSSTGSSETRRRLPQEPKSHSINSSTDNKSTEGNSWTKNRVFDSIKDTVTSASAGITALAQKFDSTIGTDTKKSSEVDPNQNDPNVKNKNEAAGAQSARRERSRRHSDLVTRDVTSVVGSTSVQERSRIYARKASVESTCTHKNSAAGSSQYCDQPGCSESRSLRSARSMDTLNKTLSTTSSGPRVRERMSSYETGQDSSSSTRKTRSSSPSSSSSNVTPKREIMRTRSRAGSDLGMRQARSTQDVTGSAGNSEPSKPGAVTRDKEALLQRDYRDVLRRLSRTRAISSDDLAKQ